MKKILFVCVENSCRSQIAQGLANSLGAGIVEAYSAGSKPSGEVNPLAIQVMREIGLDISFQHSKGFEKLPMVEFDYVVTLGCKDVCPFVPAKEHIEWQIDDPKGKGVDFFRHARDSIRSQIEQLIKNIKDNE